MEQRIISKKTNVSFSKSGKGKTVVLLHGYLEKKEYWNEIIARLEKTHRVIAVDLPGHGKTGVFSETHSMEFMADVVKKVLDHLKIKSCQFIGHSMGGYTALAFAEKYPDIVRGLCLLHSHPFADSEEKKENRLKEVELIRKGKKDLIYKVSIPNLYATDNLEKLRDKVNLSMETAFATTENGVVAALLGMRVRPDRSKVLASLSEKSFLIIGKKDNLIPWQNLTNLANQYQIGYGILENSGHMGFFEESEETITLIKLFLAGNE